MPQCDVFKWYAFRSEISSLFNFLFLLNHIGYTVNSTVVLGNEINKLRSEAPATESNIF